MKHVFLLFTYLLVRAGIVTAQQRNNAAPIPAKTLCIPGLPNRIEFDDCQHYLLIKNTLTKQRYIYWKSRHRLDAVQIDTSIIKRIYLDYFKDTAACIDYMAILDKGQFKPKIVSLCAYDDTTVLACVETFKADSIVDHTQLYSRVYSMLEIGIRKPVKLFYVDKALPDPISDLYPEIFAYKRTLYFSISPDTDDTAIDHSRLYNLAKMKKQGFVYSLDKMMPTTINDYLVVNNVFHNYNAFYADNGYALMSLSNYVLNLETGERIFLPIADSVFRNIRIDPKTFDIPHYVYDFKYNKAQGKFYLRYSRHNNIYVASFRPHASIFDTNVLVYAVDGRFGAEIRSVCLSWNGEQVMYSMKGDSCFHYATPSELQTIARDYRKEQ